MHPLPLYVTRASRGDKYWFVSVSVPVELLPQLRSDAPYSEVAKHLASLMTHPRTERNDRG